MTTSDDLVLHDRSLAELDSATLVHLLRLRCDVFVVEQACAYPEIDDHDADDSTRHLWLAPADTPSVVASYLRVIEPSRSATTVSQRIGRVVTAAAWRGHGLGARLIRHVLTAYPGPTTLEAQSHLQAYYERLGFTVSGPAYVEDGIPHLPMRLRGAQSDGV